MEIKKMKSICVAVLAGALSVSVVAEPELKGSPQELRGFLHPSEKVITINGEAEEKAYSDQAVVSLVITTENKMLSQSVSENSALRQKVTEALIKSNISEDAIKSSKFSSTPEYGWFGAKPNSYVVVNRMAVTIYSEEGLKEIAVVADKFDGVDFSDATFEHSKKEEYNEKVREKALEKIKRQKKFYEQSLGLKLTPVGVRNYSLEDGGSQGALMLQEVVVTAAKREGKSKAYSSARHRSSSMGASFDEVVYSATLSVDFKIE